MDLVKYNMAVSVINQCHTTHNNTSLKLPWGHLGSVATYIMNFRVLVIIWYSEPLIFPIMTDDILITATAGTNTQLYVSEQP